MEIRLLETEAERNEVYGLVYREFLSKGYIEPNTEGRFVHYQGLLDNIPQTDVFLAYDQGNLIGTNSLTVDSDNGIHTNVDFPRQTMRERMTGRVLASSWRIVVDSAYRDGAKLLRGLVRASARRGIARGVETCLYTFHPRHALTWMKLLGAEVVDFNEHTDGLRGAPALLLRGYKEDLPEWITKEL